MASDVTTWVTHNGSAVVLEVVAVVIELQEAPFQLQERARPMNDRVPAGFYYAVSAKLVLLGERDQVVR